MKKWEESAREVGAGGIDGSPAVGPAAIGSASIGSAGSGQGSDAASATGGPDGGQDCNPSSETAVLLDAIIHDLRTPLSAMSGWLEVLEAHFDDAQGLVARALVGLRRGVESQTESLNGLSDVLMKQRIELPAVGECVLLERLQAALGRMAHRSPPMPAVLSARLTPISLLDPGNSLTCKDAGSSLDDACETLLYALALSQGNADGPLSVVAGADKVMIAIPGGTGDLLPIRSLCYGLVGQRARYAEIRPPVLWLARSLFQRSGLALQTASAVGGFSLLVSRASNT